ncbi:hypothetical protein GCM10023148_22610 [Actinokineospora soli]
MGPVSDRARITAAVGLLGLVTAVVGMFLPWLRSGAVLRDSFEVVGVIETLGFLRGDALEWLLYAWYALVPVITLSIAAYALGARRVGATFALLATIILGTIAGGARVEAGDGGDGAVVITATGPTVSLIGAALALAAALVTLIGERGRTRENAGGER